MKNFTYTALTSIKVGGVVVKTDETVVLDEQTGGELVDQGLVQLSSEEPVEIELAAKPVARKVAAAKTKPAKKTGR